MIIKTIDYKKFDTNKTYYKVTNATENHHDLQFHDGLNVDPIPFYCNSECSAGGIYFSDIKNIFNFIEYGCYIREITIPDDALVYQEEHKYKASKLIFGKRIDINLDSIKYLVENGADIHIGYDNILRWSVQKNYFDIFKYVAEKGANIHIGYEYVLLVAAENGSLDIVKYLAENGADIHTNNEYALRLAAGYNQLDILKYLVEKGANIHADNDYALRWAARNGHLDIVKYLAENGVNIHAEYDDALRWAAENGHQDVVDYIKSLK